MDTEVGKFIFKACSFIFYNDPIVLNILENRLHIDLVHLQLFHKDPQKYKDQLTEKLRKEDEGWVTLR